MWPQIIFLLCFLIWLIGFYKIIIKESSLKQSDYTDMYLNNYQVQVYDDKHDMIHCDIYDGFTAEDAIRLCRDVMRRDGILPTNKPIKFFTLNKTK